MYERILVPLKEDSTDKTIVAHAGALAGMSGGKVTLLRVIHSHSRDEAAFFEDHARVYLEAQVAGLAAQGVVADSKVVSGEPAASIVAVARELVSDLVVMATHGHSEVRHVLMGSVTEDVVRSSPTPVLLVRPS
jgi:nucleotide-binding universal stress UspA family protein